jgi:DNA repair exonuclease SbcCD ATPase subunit
MDAVFDNPYSLAIHFGEKRGKTEAELMFVRGELEMPPIGSAGGGAIDVASLALRIAYWSMRQDSKVSSVLLLDEPFKQLKGETANLRALQLIQELSHTLGIQVIMISDERVNREDIIDNADKVYYVSQKKGVSNVRVIE